MCTMAGTRLGYFHETVTAEPDGHVVTETESRMLARRGGDLTRAEVDERWVELETGEALSYRSVRMLSAQPTELVVTVDSEGMLTLKRTSGDDVSFSTLESDAAMAFPEAVRTLHEGRGFVPGDAYTYAQFDGAFEKVGRTNVTVVGEEGILVAGEFRALNRLVLRSDLYPGIETIEWLDDEGRVWRSEIPATGLVLERTSREAALGEGELADLMASMSVPTDTKIADPHDVDNALYEVWIDGDDALRVIPQDARQRIEGRTERGAVLSVRRVVPGAAARPRATPPSGMEQYLEGNALLQTWYPLLIAAAAKSVRGAGGDAWEGAKLVERFVFDNIDHKGFGTAFGSATEVLSTRSGDCSEHAVLMAAMTRAVGIPSKLAEGLVYFEGQFAYHMWVEVWTGDGWYALDPTVGGGSVDATHIKLAESAAKDGVVADLSASVLRTLGRLHVRVVSYSSQG